MAERHGLVGPLPWDRCGGDQKLTPMETAELLGCPLPSLLPSLAGGKVLLTSVCWALYQATVSQIFTWVLWQVLLLQRELGSCVLIRGQSNWAHWGGPQDPPVVGESSYACPPMYASLRSSTHPPVCSPLHVPYLSHTLAPLGPGLTRAGIPVRLAKPRPYRVASGRQLDSCPASGGDAGVEECAFRAAGHRDSPRTA